MLDPETQEVDRWRDTYRETQSSGSSECPDPETLSGVATGELAEAEREALSDHVVACRRCTAVLRDLLALDSEARADADLPGGFRERPVDPPVTSRWRLGAAAAVLVLALGLAVTMWPTGEPMVPPASGERGPRPATPAVLPAVEAVLPIPPERLEWSSVEGASSYRVVLYDSESTPLWESPDLPEPVAAVPPEVRDGMTPGTYYWRASALVGVESQDSALYRFTIAR